MRAQSSARSSDESTVDESTVGVAVGMLRESVLLGRRAETRAAAALAAEGFVLDEWLVLAALAEADGMSMSEVREATGLDKATLGRRVDLLSSKALVYREVDDRDRRVIRCFVSARGRDVLERLTARLGRDA